MLVLKFFMYLVEEEHMIVGQSHAENYIADLFLQFPVFMYLQKLKGALDNDGVFGYPQYSDRFRNAADGHTSQISCEVIVKQQN